MADMNLVDLRAEIVAHVTTTPPTVLTTYFPAPETVKAGMMDPAKRLRAQLFSEAFQKGMAIFAIGTVEIGRYDGVQDADSSLVTYSMRALAVPVLDVASWPTH